jgi:hypothetical protein
VFIPDETAFAWAIEKALLIVVSGLSAIVGLAWMGSKKIFADRSHGSTWRRHPRDHRMKGSL